MAQPLSLAGLQNFAAATYDYVIAGGGTAGLVLANRLSENPSVSVAVLEAGLDHSDESIVQYLTGVPQQLGNASYDWLYTTNVNDRTLQYPTGRQLGGSSALGNGFWNPPTRRDFDDWFDLGNPGWEWRNLIPYIFRSESFSRPNLTTHGYQGPIRTSVNNVSDKTQNRWSDTFSGLGLPLTDDPFDGQDQGPFQAILTQDRANLRSHSASAYYNASLQARRPNLHVVVGARADRLTLVNNSDGSVIATGLIFNALGREFFAKAGREVILSLGAIGSPKMLELSGIGNSSLLENLGIPRMIDLPGVGENLQDHPQISLAYRVADGLNASNPLAASNSYVSFPDVLSVGRLQNVSVRQDLDIYNNSQLASAQFTLRESINTTNSSYFSLTSTLMYPFSRGSTHINISGVTERPTLDLRMLSSPTDVSLLGTMAIFLQKLARTAPMSDSFLRNGTVLAPGQTTFDDRNVSTVLRQTATPSFDLAGSCAMRPRRDGGVVSPRLMVYGTRNLRVVDASIIPLLPASGLLPVVYGIAEKAADIIKTDAVPKV